MKIRKRNVIQTIYNTPGINKSHTNYIISTLPYRQSLKYIQYEKLSLTQKKQYTNKLESLSGLRKATVLVGKSVETLKLIKELGLIKVQKDIQWEIGTGITMKKLKNINNKIKMGSYQGLRHKKKLPVRGQRTRSNAQTIKRSKI